MAIRKRAPHRSLRFRSGRRRSLQPILENLENRLVLSSNVGLASSLASHGGRTETIALPSASFAIGTGSNTLNRFTDQRGDVPPAGIWHVRAHRFDGGSVAAPTASLVANNVTVADYGKTTYTFSVTYASNAAISAASLVGSVVAVTPPSGQGGAITAKVESTVANGPTDPSGDAQSFTVTYMITPPGGSWTSAHNGTYSISLGGSPITDINGTPIPTGTVGTFSVETASISVTRFGLILNHHTGFFSGTIFLKNSGSSAFSGPLFLVFDNLTSGAVLENATGTYGGNDYLEISVGTVAPGQTVTTTVVFNKSLVNYTPVLYVGGLGL